MTEDRSRRLPDSEIDWLSIEAKFRAGASARELAAEAGIGPNRILRRAKRFAWLQDPSGLKRERVKASLLGSPGVAGADSLIETAAAEDVADMNLGLANARRILRSIGRQLEEGVVVLFKEDGTPVRGEAGPKDLRTLGAANLAAIETVRRVRELDDPAAGGRGIYTKEERDALVAAALGPGA